jgi:glucose-1-phosphate cytidylyltransferase
MNIYATQGFTDFVIATGYRGEVIRDWVKNLSTPREVEALDTGLETQTAGRIRQAFEYVN